MDKNLKDVTDVHGHVHCVHVLLNTNNNLALFKTDLLLSDTY